LKLFIEWEIPSHPTHKNELSFRNSYIFAHKFILQLALKEPNMNNPWLRQG